MERTPPATLLKLINAVLREQDRTCSPTSSGAPACPQWGNLNPAPKLAVVDNAMATLVVTGSVFEEGVGAMFGVPSAGTTSFTGCTFKNTVFGLSLVNGFSPASIFDVLVSSNTFENIGNAGIWVITTTPPVINLSCNRFDATAGTKYGIYVTATGTLADIGTAATPVANVWPFTNRSNSTAPSTWTQPSGWTSLYKASPGTSSIRYYGVGNDMVATTSTAWPSNGFFKPVTGIYAQATASQSCSAVFGRIYKQVCFNAGVADPLYFPCNLRIGITEAEGAVNAQKVRLFPNPTDNVVQMAGGDNSTYRVFVQDMWGVRLLEHEWQGQGELSLKQLGAGCYLIGIMNLTTNQLQYEKVVVQ